MNATEPNQIFFFSVFGFSVEAVFLIGHMGQTKARPNMLISIGHDPKLI